MFRRSKIPDWVKSLPKNDSNRELLVQLSEASPNSLDTPREMNFAIKDFVDHATAKAACDRVESAGWRCVISQDVQSQGRYWLEAQKNDYVLSRDGLEGDEEFFMRLANLHSAIYDGWYASVV